jgi:hypothetical protein
LMPLLRSWANPKFRYNPIAPVFEVSTRRRIVLTPLSFANAKTPS